MNIDLEKFFDNVLQNGLTSYVHYVIKDNDTKSLICKYLNAEVMTPQGYKETKLSTILGGKPFSFSNAEAGFESLMPGWKI